MSGPFTRMLWQDKSDRIYVIPLLSDKEYNEKEAGTEFDIYEFGFVVYELITGQQFSHELSHEQDQQKILNTTILTK